MRLTAQTKPPDTQGLFSYSNGCVTQGARRPKRRRTHTWQSNKTKTAFDDFIPAVGKVLDRLSDVGRDALYRKMTRYMVAEMEIDALTRHIPVPDDVVAEVVGEQLKSAGDVEVAIEAYVNDAGR